MKSSIFSKILISYLSIILLFSILTPVLISTTISKHYISTLSEELKKLGLSLSYNLKPIINKHDLRTLQHLTKQIGKKIQTRITVISADGKVLSDSEKDPITMENHKNRPEVKDALSGKIGLSLRFSTTVGKQMLYVAVPVYNQNKIIAVIRTSLFIEQINQLLAQLNQQILKLALIIALLSILLALFFSHSFSRPIEIMTRASKKIAQGNFEVEIDVNRYDELGRLGSALKQMSDQLKELFNEINQEKEKIQAIISCLQEPLCLINQNGIITMCNKSFQKTIHPDPLNKPYWEILLSREILSLIEQTFAEKNSLTGNVQIGQRFFLCGLSFIPSQKELIMILHDITEQRKLEELKKEFITNASHELRTPLTAIVGYIETLEEDLSGEAKEYTKIIKKHINRLSNIVNDLLLLSEIEQQTNMQTSQVDLTSIIKEVIKTFSPKAQKKGLTITYQIPPKPIIITADELKIEQAIINLLDNAIKYTEKGQIEIILYTTNQDVIIKIKDTGIGIPKQALSRIFERFYVVDKSRSRKLGGTGLGLSIVKHIISLHNGSIKVESQLNKGTIFTITLPYT